MATREPSHDADSRRGESTIKAAAFEISLYIAVYLAVWVILRVMSVPGPAAVAPDSSMPPPPAAIASTPPASADESPPE